MGKRFIFDESLTTDELSILGHRLAGLLARQEVNDLLPTALALRLESSDFLAQQGVNVAAADVQDVIALMRLNYDRTVARRETAS